MFSRLLRSTLLFSALLAGSQGLFAQGERRWQDAELAPLGKSFVAYIEARATGSGIERAKSEVTKNMALLRSGADGLDPLSRPLDLQRALALSRDLGRQSANKGKVTQDLFTDCNLDGKGLAYAYLLPQDYDPALRNYPLLLAIPDENESPAEHIRAHWISREVQSNAILVAVQMPASQGEWERVIVNGRPGGLSYAMTALRMATERFAVDFDRIYVVGRGKGVPAAIAAGNYSPQRFAGILGRAGDAGEIGPENFSNLPTYFAGAGARASAFQEAARVAGHDNCTLDRSGVEKDLWTWIEKHPRTAYPSRAEVVPGDPFPTRAYWLRVAPSELSPRAVAEIDRATNSITIRCEGVSHVTLFLNDALVDLDKPLRIVCNNVERGIRATRSPRISRHLQDALDLMLEGISEPGGVYVAQVIVPTSPESVGVESASPVVPDPEFDAAASAAGDDPEKLWALHQWCASTQRTAASNRVVLRMLRRAPDHEGARAALGHRFALGQWFTTQAAYDRFQRSQEPVSAAAKGHIQFKSLWMHPEERALVGKGWVKEHETGLWNTTADRKRLSEGWARQDLEWISSAETAQMDLGLWKVDGEWVELTVANERRARIDAMWRIPTADVLLYSTASRETCTTALSHMSRAVDDLRKVFGAEPVLPLKVAMLSDEAQYDRFAFGDHDGRRRATHAGRLHIVHSAFFAENWFTRSEGKREFSGMGVCYWDAWAPGGNLYGVHAARLAVGLSYVDALDPSPKAVRQGLSSAAALVDFNAYESEKQLPAWLRWGGAVYAERYFRDDTVAADGDPLWARKWSLENLAQRNGLQPLAEILAFKLDPNDRDASLKLLIQAGLLVSFMVDGDCAPVSDAHREFRAAMAGGSLHPRYVTALTEALAANEAQLRAYSVK